MAENAKFLFDTEFVQTDSKVSAAPVRREKTYWTTEERNLAGAEGFERGKLAGIEEANATIAARTAAALEHIAQNVQTLTGQLDNEYNRLKSEGVILANLIAKSLAASLIQRQPLHEIEALFKEAINFMPNTPHIAVRVNETVLEAAKEKLDAIAVESGFFGKIILVGESEIPLGDCRIEWAHGGIVKDHTGVRKKIQELTTRYIDTSYVPDGLALDRLEPAAPPHNQDELEGREIPDQVNRLSDADSLPEEK